MDEHKANTILLMVLGAKFGLLICAISFAIMGTVSATLWIELMPKGQATSPLIMVILPNSPIQVGTIPSATFGAIFGSFWGAFDSRVGKLALRLFQGEFNLPQILRWVILVVILGSIILGLIGVFVTTLLWYI